MPGGINVGFNLVALPFWMTQAGISVERASSVVALSLLAASWKAILAPLVDLGSRRRNWFLLGNIVAAFCILLSFRALESGSWQWLSALLFGMNTAMAFAENALTSLCATMVHPRNKSIASGYYSVGQLCWGGLFGALMLTLHEPPHLLGYTLPAMSLHSISLLMICVVILFSSLVTVIDEPVASRKQLRQHALQIAKDVWRVLRSFAGWSCLLICLSPLGSTAATNLFGMFASDYGVSATTVAMVTGIGFVGTSGLGAMIGGWVAARYGARATYLGSAAVLGLCGLAMALSPAQPFFYVFWCLAYSVVSGAIYSSFFALIFGLIEPSPGATTLCGILVGASNIPLSYVTFLDGRMYRHGGRVGLLLSDAASNFIGVLMIGVVLYLISRRKAAQISIQRSPKPAAAPALARSQSAQ